MEKTTAGRGLAEQDTFSVPTVMGIRSRELRGSHKVAHWKLLPGVSSSRGSWVTPVGSSASTAPFTQTSFRPGADTGRF